MSIIRQHPKKHNPKAVPLGGRGTALVVEGGNSLSNQDYPPTNAPIPATAKQEPEMSRPPWGKVAGVSLTEGGNSLSNQDCPPTKTQNLVSPQWN